MKAGMTATVLFNTTAEGAREFELSDLLLLGLTVRSHHQTVPLSLFSIAQEHDLKMGDVIILHGHGAWGVLEQGFTVVGPFLMEEVADAGGDDQEGAEPAAQAARPGL